MAGGRNAQIGIKSEVTYGTAIAVDKFTEFNQEDLGFKDERLESKGLRAGAKTLRTDQWVPGRAGGEGSVKMEAQYNGMGAWLKPMFGGVTTVEVGSFTPHLYASTFIPTNALDSLSSTIQVGRPQLDGTVIPHTYDGAKVTEWTITVEENGLMEFDVQWDFRNMTVGGASEFALQSPVYVDPTTPYAFTRFVLTIAGTPVQARKVTIKGTTALETDRWFLGSRYKTAQVEGSGEYTKYTVEFDMDYISPALYALVTSGAPTAVALLGTGPLTSTSGSEYKLNITLPATRFDGENVEVSGPDLLEQTLMGRGLDDGTDSPITVVYTSLTAYSTPV